MIRASSAHRICTSRPVFDQSKYDAAFKDCKEAVEKKKEDFKIEKLQEYTETVGIATKAKALQKEIDNKILVQQDPLPAGAYNYLQCLWLEENGFISHSNFGFQPTALLKGTHCEQMSIDGLNQYYKISLSKCDRRLTKGFLSGECDIEEIDTISDVKNAETWETYRNVEGISTEYHWQLVAYCYLYEKAKAQLVYTLNVFPEELIPIVTSRYSEEQLMLFHKGEEFIRNLDFKYRHKIYHIESDVIKNDIEFLKSRLVKAEAYYKTLTIEKCLRLHDNTTK